jgi:peptide/nickel transport system substrate-binding protein
MPRSPLLSSLASLAGLILILVLAGPRSVAAEETAQPRHGLAMHGDPALPAGFSHFPYVNPDAPRGGRLTLALQGTFDSLNPLIVLGVAPDAAARYVLQSLMARSLDEPFTLYGLVAQTVEMPEDRASVTFNLDPRARFSDGHPLTTEDVRFTFELLKKHGKPLHRSSFGQVTAVEVEGPYRIRFDLAGSKDRELPLIIGLMPIFAAHATDPERFDRTSLTPPIGSGPYRIDEVRPGERIVLRRRSDYWAESLPVTRGLYNFDEIRYDFYRDANSLFEAFKAGLYDLRFEDDPGRWATAYDFPALRENRVRREVFPIRTPKGMNGLVFNTRRRIFADIRVREALGLMLDFEWVNRNLYSGLLQRTASYFHGSELSAYARPATEAEHSLLKSFPGSVRADVLDGRWTPPRSDGSGRDRDLARRALDLLSEAGWTLREGVLRNAKGEPFAFEMLANTLFQERLALNFAQSLARIGVALRIRRVDEPQYWRRLSRFEYDMMQRTWAVSLSPGAEQRNRWSTRAAGQDGSLNYAGVRSPAADAMMDAMLAAEGRDDFVAAVRALDRVLLSGFYVVPLFHVADYWLAYDTGLKHPATMPLLGISVDSWWREP